MLPDVCRRFWLLLIKRKEMSGCDRDRCSNSALIYPASVAAVFKNLRRTGVLKNRLRIINVVPSGAPTSSKLISFPPSITYRIPVKLSAVFVTSSICETAAMLERASPRKPKEETFIKPSMDLILLVEWRKNASLISSGAIPLPLSVMRIKEIPPSLISMVMAVAPASIAFSTSSFTTEEGRSITSPAAILLIVL